MELGIPNELPQIIMLPARPAAQIRGIGTTLQGEWCSLRTSSVTSFLLGCQWQPCRNWRAAQSGWGQHWARSEWICWQIMYIGISENYPWHTHDWSNLFLVWKFRTSIKMAVGWLSILAGRRSTHAMLWLRQAVLGWDWQGTTGRWNCLDVRKDHTQLCHDVLGYCRLLSFDIVWYRWRPRCLSKCWRPRLPKFPTPPASQRVSLESSYIHLSYCYWMQCQHSMS